MMKKGIADFLLKHKAIAPVSFHMPGHKGSAFYRRYGYSDFMNSVADCDITEIPGADNLFQTEGVIKETMEKYIRLYETKHSYLLINGTSGGIIAAVLSSVKNGGKLVMARNCHKSVFNALTLGSIDPIYAYAEQLREYGISGRVEADEIRRLLDENEDAEAVILPSPNYYGICSDIEAIAEVVHEKNKILIVDQAHGAHLKFFEKYTENSGLPRAAESCGADIVINSIHKTLGSMTQSAVLNLNSNRVDRHILEDRLQAVESTSPSYILMASLDINADILEKNGSEAMGLWLSNLDRFYEAASGVEGIKLMTNKEALDRTKINIDTSTLGISGAELEAALMKRRIFPELVTGNIVMCMTGIGNSRSDFDSLLTALTEIALKSKGFAHTKISRDENLFLTTKRRYVNPVPTVKTRVPLENSAGRICASSIIPYPPGIPFICPGEEIGEDEIKYIRLLRDRGEKVIGVDDEGCVSVGTEQVR